MHDGIAADLNDLYAILDRYGDQETAGIRRILGVQQSARAACAGKSSDPCGASSSSRM